VLGDVGFEWGLFLADAVDELLSALLVVPVVTIESLEYVGTELTVELALLPQLLGVLAQCGFVPVVHQLGLEVLHLLAVYFLIAIPLALGQSVDDLLELALGDRPARGP
jgi:hypothetical protein